LTFRPCDDSESRVAFAVSRNVGTAVERNRIRRRLRAILQELDRESETLPPPGDLLVRVTGPLEGWSHVELRTTMIDLLLLVSK